MREIVVISGKGGTGKTSVTAALADLISEEEPLVLCDFDVDAPDLHILAKPMNTVSTDFVSGHTAISNPTNALTADNVWNFVLLTPSPKLKTVNTLYKSQPAKAVRSVLNFARRKRLTLFRVIAATRL